MLPILIGERGSLQRVRCIPECIPETKSKPRTLFLRRYGALIGGAGGNRTRVRKSATSSSTCVVRSIEFSLGAPAEQARFRRFTEFSSRTP